MKGVYCFEMKFQLPQFAFACENCYCTGLDFSHSNYEQKPKSDSMLLLASLEFKRIDKVTLNKPEIVL